MTISLRNLPPEIEEKIRETSRNEGLSLNKATLRLLEATIKKPVNLDATEDHVLALRVRNKSDHNIRIAVALKTGQWVYFESTQQSVKDSDGWKEMRFDLKGKDFKSQKSDWANNASIDGLDDVKEVQVLIYNQDAEGSALISGMRFLSDKEL